MENNAFLIVFAGANGAGKSTAISKYLKEIDIGYICPDIIAATEYSHISDIKNRYLLAMNEAESIRNNFLHNKVPFAFETVLSTREKIDFLKTCKKNDYYIVGIYISTLKPEINQVRIKKRVEYGGHDVPNDKIYSRYDKSLKLLPELIKVADFCLVYDNSGEKLLIEFIKDNDKHFIYETNNYVILDFVNKFIVKPLESDGIKCEILSNKDIDNELVKSISTNSIEISIKKRIVSAVNKTGSTNKPRTGKNMER